MGAETQMRKENLRLEAELRDMIAKYDTDMFHRTDTMAR